MASPIAGVTPPFGPNRPTTSLRLSINWTIGPAVMSVPTSTPILFGPASTLKLASILFAFRAFSVAWKAVTYILANPSTRYQNGLDAHLDTRASSFLAKQLNVGLVGFHLQQISGDHG